MRKRYSKREKERKELSGLKITSKGRLQSTRGSFHDNSTEVWKTVFPVAGFRLGEDASGRLKKTYKQRFQVLIYEKNNTKKVRKSFCGGVRFQLGGITKSHQGKNKKFYLGHFDRIFFLKLFQSHFHIVKKKKNYILCKIKIFRKICV